MPKLAILLCTKNGSQYLIPQLESIKKQFYKNFDIFIKDNHSDDDTLQVIKDFKKNNHDINIEIILGDNLHFANSYISLAKIAFDKGRYDFFAFCDQDDEWHPNHLSRSVEFINSNNEDLAWLFCSRTVLIDNESNIIGMSKFFKKSPCFRNALTQSLAGGNTMVFNKKACKNLFTIDINSEIISHDWLMYILISGSGGKIKYSASPSVSYRQHENNTIGSNKSLKSNIKRMLMIFSGEFHHYNNVNVNLIKKLDFFTFDNKETLAFFSKSLQGSIFKRLNNLYCSKVHRQTNIGNLALWINVIVNSNHDRGNGNE